MNRSLVEALQLNSARGVDSLSNGCRRLARLFARKLLIAERRQFDLNIDLVQNLAPLLHRLIVKETLVYPDIRATFVASG